MEYIWVKFDIIDLEYINRWKLCWGYVYFCDLFFIYFGGIKVFKGFDFEIKVGEKVGIVGFSGFGKFILVIFF